MREVPGSIPGAALCRLQSTKSSGLELQKAWDGLQVHEVPQKEGPARELEGSNDQRSFANRCSSFPHHHFAAWSSGMILASGARAPGFNSRSSTLSRVMVAGGAHGLWWHIGKHCPASSPRDARQHHAVSVCVPHCPASSHCMANSGAHTSISQHPLHQSQLSATGLEDDRIVEAVLQKPHHGCLV